MLNACDPAFIDRLTLALPPGRLRAPEPADLTEPRGRWQGLAGIVAEPRNVEEVATIVRACHEARVGIVPLAGGTGLVGGQVMPAGPQPLVLSVQKMNALRGIWPDERAMVVEAGMTLAEAQAAAADAGLLFPLSLASEGSCRIGGNLSTNAGGTAVLRYGNMRDLCLGLEAVLPDGSIWHGLKRLRKDNTGYDLKNLLIGAEGSLGIITAASLRLFPRPKHRVVAMLVVESPTAAQKLLSLFEARVSGLVTGFELISGMGFAFLEEGGLGLKSPFGAVPDWAVLVELGLPELLAPEEVMAALYAEAADIGLVQDGVIAASEAQADQLWAIRETIPEGNRRVGSIASHDISLPLSEIPDFIESAREALARMGDMRLNCFGHLGDGNLHFNLFPAKGKHRDAYEALRKPISELVHEMVVARGGSFSAEHGVGRLKAGDLARWGDPARLAAMAAIKAALDPEGIMNPGAVLGQS